MGMTVIRGAGGGGELDMGNPELIGYIPSTAGASLTIPAEYALIQVVEQVLSAPKNLGYIPTNAGTIEFRFFYSDPVWRGKLENGVLTVTYTNHVGSSVAFPVYGYKIK